jgi:chromosome segregation ATPase
MSAEKPLPKMLKKELIQYIKELEKKAEEHSKAFISWENYRKSIEPREEKLKEERYEAIKALEVWKSACLEAQDANKHLQGRINVLRNMMELELVKNPLDKIEDPEEKSNVIHTLITKLARKLVDMEGKIKPIMRGFLPMPEILKGIDEWKAKHRL